MRREQGNGQLKILKAQSQQKFVPSTHSYWVDAFSMKTQQFECVRLNFTFHKLNKKVVYFLTDMGNDGNKNFTALCGCWGTGLFCSLHYSCMPDQLSFKIPKRNQSYPHISKLQIFVVEIWGKQHFLNIIFEIPIWIWCVFTVSISWLHDNR